MNAQRINDTNWFLDDKDLFDLLTGLSVNKDGKRGYFSCDYKGKGVFLKFFKEKGFVGYIRNKLLPRGRKEYSAGKKLLALSITTPQPLGYGISDRGSSIIQERIEGDTLINLFLKSKERKDFLLRLTQLLRELKKGKVVHNDLHLNNIIVSNNDLYLIDLHKMQFKRYFTLKDEISNMSHAVTMLYGDMTEEEKAFFFRQYPRQDIRTYVEKEMARLWKRWIIKKQKRAFENTSKIIVSGDYVCIRGKEVSHHGALPDLLKKDKKIIVERFDDHIRKNYRNRRRLKLAWKNHVVLKYLNLNITPEAYFMKNNSLFSWGYIAMEDLKGSGIELDRYLDKTYDSANSGEKRSFLDKFLLFLVFLFKNKIAHRDLKACNIFALKENRFLLLDVEDILFTAIDEERLKSMLVQLNTTIPKRISIRDRIRVFLKVTKALNMDKKQIFKDIQIESLKREIVYEGSSGLCRESW